jgi:hypothetical protein
LDGESARRKVTTYTGQHNTEKRGHTSIMHRAGFEPTVPVFERLKTVRALDRAVTGTGWITYIQCMGIKTLTEIQWVNMKALTD